MTLCYFLSFVDKYQQNLYNIGDKMNIGERIKNLRKGKNWNQAELGAKIGLGDKAISSFEKERNAPSTEIIIKLSEIFEVSTDYLLTGKEEPTGISADEKEVIEIMRGNDDFKKAVKQAASFQKKAVNYLGSYAAANQNAAMG
jgi:transcriptional regulator with XRE-family HTH domain